jgi:hypothetical protein
MRRLPEGLLWDDLRDAMGTLWFARRIEDKLGAGLPDVSFAGKKRRYAWMELKVVQRQPKEDRAFDIEHFTAEQRAFGLQSLQSGGASSWWLMTRTDTVDHLHRATIIDDLGEVKYSVFRNRAAWVGRISPDVAGDIARILFA